MITKLIHYELNYLKVDNCQKLYELGKTANKYVEDCELKDPWTEILYCNLQKLEQKIKKNDEKKTNKIRRTISQIDYNIRGDNDNENIKFLIRIHADYDGLDEEKVKIMYNKDPKKLIRNTEQLINNAIDGAKAEDRKAILIPLNKIKTFFKGRK